MPRVAALLDVMQVSDIIEVVDASTFKRPIYAGNAIQTVKSDEPKKVITVRTASFQAAGEGGSAAIEEVAGGGRSGPFDLRRGPAVGERPAGTDLGEDHHLGRARARLEGEVRGGDHPGRRQARRRRRREPRRRRRRLRAERLAGRPDRQGGRPRPLHRLRHLRRHPAPRRHEGFEGHRRHQQGRGGADLPGRRLRPRRRPLRGPAGTSRRRSEAERAADGAGRRRLRGRPSACGARAPVVLSFRRRPRRRAGEHAAASSRLQQSGLDQTSRRD